MYPHASYKLNQKPLNNRNPTWCTTLKTRWMKSYEISKWQKIKIINYTSYSHPPHLGWTSYLSSSSLAWLLSSWSDNYQVSECLSLVFTITLFFSLFVCLPYIQPLWLIKSLFYFILFYHEIVPQIENIYNLW
jgi:hypothetical protein